MSYDTTEVLKEFDEEFTEPQLMSSDSSAPKYKRGYVWKDTYSSTGLSEPTPVEVKTFLASALQKAYEAGEAHGAVKEREELGGQIRDWIKKMNPDRALDLDVALTRYSTPKARVADAAMRYAYEHILGLIDGLTPPQEEK